MCVYTNNWRQDETGHLYYNRGFQPARCDLFSNQIVILKGEELYTYIKLSSQEKNQKQAKSEQVLTVGSVFMYWECRVFKQEGCNLYPGILELVQ